MISGFEGWMNQPALRDLGQFILTDLGSHVLDTTRFLFGEARTVDCIAQRTPLERECFPQTLMFVESDEGSLELDANYGARVTARRGTVSVRHAPHRFEWANLAHDVVHASIVSCDADLFAALRGETAAETTGEDNLRAVDLVFEAYELASTGQVIRLAVNPGSQ